MKQVDTVILGGGIAGLAISYFLRQKGIASTIYEKNSELGGLCKSFSIEGFDFDYGGHVSFTKNEAVREILEKDIPCSRFVADTSNYKEGKWIKNPVQNNLYVLDVEEKIKIISSFVGRKKENPAGNYEEWLRCHYGDYFAENYPFLYTRKYWTVEPGFLETKWVGKRMYVPTLEEMLYGAFSDVTPNVHYSGNSRYPLNGGFGLFLTNLAGKAAVECDKEAVRIDASGRNIYFSDGTQVQYRHIFSTIPLPELMPLLDEVPEDVRRAAEALKYTSMVLISVGIKGGGCLPAATFYIYDEDISISRVFSTSRFGNKSIPKGCETLQAEVYFSKYKPLQDTPESVGRKAIHELEAMGIFEEKDIAVSDIRTIRYANIMFTEDTYPNRDRIHAYLGSIGLNYAGRFGDWDYLWVDQSIESALRSVERAVID